MNQDNEHIKTLLKRCLKQNQKAQFEIYKLYYKAMYNCSLRILNDSFEAEDVMQESFLAAFKKLGSYKGEVSFGSWLKRIVINKSISSLKKKQSLIQLDDEIGTINETPVFISFDEIKNDVSYIIKKINELKPNYKIVVNLNLIEGYDTIEISQILNISHANCRTMLSRAKNKLRVLLKPEYEQ
ncbi:MAG: RNA polymerase sigma factor [Lutibacter sp.]